MDGKDGCAVSKDLLPIRISGNGIAHKLEVGGRDISGWVSRLELEIDPSDGGAVLRLSMCAVDVSAVDTRAQVKIDAETAETLKALGWTPPPGEAT